MKNTLKCLKINTIADNEKLKEETFCKLLNMMISLNLEYSRRITLICKLPITETINGKERNFLIYTSQNQFRYKRFVFYDSMKYYHSSYVIFELSDKDFWDELKTLIEINPDVVKNIPKHPILLAGNLSKDQERKVNQQDIDDFVNKHGITYFEISVDTGKNIKESFQFLYKKLDELHP